MHRGADQNRPADESVPKEAVEVTGVPGTLWDVAAERPVRHCSLKQDECADGAVAADRSGGGGDRGTSDDAAETVADDVEACTRSCGASEPFEEAGGSAFSESQCS